MRQLASVSARTASRMIAGETGVSHTTVRRARKPTGTIVSVAKRVGNGRQGPQTTAGRPPANGNYTPARLTSMYGTAERWIALTSRVPIHIVYMSTYVADSGKLVVKPDIYGYDAERPQAKRPRGLHWSDQQRCGAGQIGTIELCALHLCGTQSGALQARSAEIRLQKPSLVEDGPVESGADEAGLIESRGAQDRAGQIEAGQIEARQFPACEVGRFFRGGLGEHRFDLDARHHGCDHVGRGEIDVTHHVLRRRGAQATKHKRGGQREGRSHRLPPVRSPESRALRAHRQPARDGRIDRCTVIVGTDGARRQERHLARIWA